MKPKYLLLLIVFLPLALGVWFYYASKSPAPQTPGDTPIDGGTTNTPQDLPNVYRDSQNGFVVQKPEGFSVTPTDEPDTKIKFTIPKKSVIQSISEVTFAVRLKNGQCEQPTGSKKTTRNNIEYIVVESGEAAAGNQYFEKSYGTTHNSVCYTLAFFMHTTTPENYANSEVEAQNFRAQHDTQVRRITQLFEDFVSSFRFE